MKWTIAGIVKAQPEEARALLPEPWKKIYLLKTPTDITDNRVINIECLFQFCFHMPRQEEPPELDGEFLKEVD